MRKIINGRRYDTEAPHTKLVGEATEGSPGSMGAWTAGLYRTSHGNYFLAGQGGGLSRWGRSVDGNALKEGKGIIPLSHTDAHAWAQRYLSPEIYARYFAEPKVK